MYEKWTIKELKEVLASQQFSQRLARHQGKSGEQWQLEISRIKQALREKAQP